MIVGMDLEWTKNKIDVLGLAWDSGLNTTATDRNDTTLLQYLDILRRADLVVGQNALDADCRQLTAEGIDVSWLEPKVYDIRLAMHATHGHLAGTGSYDLRSIILLLNSRQGQRFPLDFKRYEQDLHRTCAMDAAAALWVYPTLDRLVRSNKLEGTLSIAHQCAPIFARMREQGVRLDKQVLEQIYKARKEKTEQIIEKYHLWEERGKKKIKRVPIWRSDRILDVFEHQFGIRPKNRQRATWDKLAGDQSLTLEAREFVDSIIDLGKGANDAHWLGAVEESEEGVDFDKVDKEGFIHPRYDICGSPDRAIASGPNIQNFPRPSDDPRPIKLRGAVVPLSEEHVILGIDFCVAPETKVLKTDLTWVRADSIIQGDKIIGFDEDFHGRKAKFRRAVVERTAPTTQPCYRIATTHGEMTASAKHGWLYKKGYKSSKTNYKWRTTDLLATGDFVKFFGTSPWETDQSCLAGRVAGFLDGEGYLNKGSIGFGQNTGITLDFYKRAVADLGFTFTESARPLIYKTNKQFKYVCIGGRAEAMRLIGTLRPVRLLHNSSKLWENCGVANKRTPMARILTIEYLGELPAIAIQTSTKTLITNGFLTHNSSLETITNAYESKDMDRVIATLEKRITHEGTAKIINDALNLNLNRNQGKCINHGFDKGESPYNLARTLFKTDHPSRQQTLQCQTIVSKMLAEYPKTAKFREDLWERARDNPLVVTNSFGRRLMCFSRSKYGDAGERFAKHDPLKKYWCSCGGCAPRRDRWKYAIAFLGRSAGFDALLRAMARIWYEKRLDEYSLPYLEVHDELDYSVPRDSVDKYAQRVLECFTEPIEELGGISLPASAVYGSSWATAHG